jgi:signal transduction histidine kinase/CheY-like chemotaxis protein
MILQLGNRLVGGNNLRLPVLFALAIAFSALLMIFTFILDVWATSSRQENLASLTEQIDDQLYRKTEDIGYQLLNTVVLISARESVINKLEKNDLNGLEKELKDFYLSSNSSLITKIQLYSPDGKILIDQGEESSNLALSDSYSPLVTQAPYAIGTYISEQGETQIYASNVVKRDEKILAYLQISKSLNDLITEIAYLNKVELFLLINKDLVNEEDSKKFNSLNNTGMSWDLFENVVISSLVQGGNNIPELSETIDNAIRTIAQEDSFLQDKLSLNNKMMNLGLIPVNDLEGESLGRLLMLKDISEAYTNYQISLTITSVSFGVVISLIFIYFWFFLGRIERNISRAEQSIIESKNQAENARDEAELAKQQAEDANKIKSEFLAKMSHELRTPLNAIIGITEMMAEDAEEFGDDDYIEPLGRVLRSGKHLLSLINDILDLSKIEAGKMELHPESFDLSLFLGDLHRTCEPLAKKNQNTLKVDIDSDIKDIYADSTRLKQVLLNLVSNACKFTNDGTVQITTKQCEINSEKAVEFSIKDSGIGMEPDQLSLLFQDFQQVDSSATRKYEGTGLGLSISKKLSNLMGGEISVTSKINEGSEFIVRIPLGDVSNSVEEDIPATSAPVESATPPLETDDETPYVLIVEDDDNMVQLLKYHLGKYDVRIDCAKDGAEALDKARTRKPSLITLDINMPTLNGWDTLAAMRADKNLKEVPIVVVTVQEERQKGIELGASEYLTKPIDKDDVKMIIDRFLGELL